MIKKLHIKNFQSHRDSSLDFHPGVNVIVGKSDSGKTAVLRALRWLTTNRPSGESFRSSWGGDTEVGMEVDHGLVIRRKGSSNEYIHDGIKYTAFGTEVPDQIREALNLNDINLQAQFDQPFLLTSSPGEVASHFNKIAHIDKIDTSLKKVQQWIRETEQDINHGTKLLIKEQEELEVLSFIPKLEADVEVLEEMEQRVSSIASTKTKLNNLIESIISTKSDLFNKSRILKAEKPVYNTLSLFDKRDDLETKIKQIKNLIGLTKSVKKEMEELSFILTAEPLVLKLVSLKEKQEKTQSALDRLTDIVFKALSVGKVCKETTDELEALKVLYIKEFPNTCPLCGQTVDLIHKQL